MKIFCRSLVFLFVTLFAVTVVSAQLNYWNVENEITKTLLKKDLRLAIKDAESPSSNDLKSLLRLLSLYRRAADSQKLALTVRQILNSADYRANSSQVEDFVRAAFISEYFQDAETLRVYLQKGVFNEDIYGKFVKICSQNKSACDVEGFDAWLVQKSSEAEKSKDNYWDKFDWTYRLIGWRRQFGLDDKAITNRFFEDVRNNPSDLETALRYIKFFKTPADLEWLAETFSSAQAFDYYELGERIGNLPNSFPPSASSESQQIRRVAVRFLLKSLATPFNEKDVSLMYGYRFRYVSIPVKVKNPEKQIRFWTKTALAENYKNAGEAQNAQPIVEELTKLDKSDILSENPAYLSGTVQAQSGARAVEAEILRQQATRQDSYQYWNERINYYRGRNEPELMFSAYLQSFAVVPFDLSKQGAEGARIFQIRWFADFARHDFGYYKRQDDSENWSAEEKRKHQFWKDAEDFLRTEFEKTKSNAKYSYELAQIIEQNEFKDLSNEILSTNSEILINAAKIGAFNSSDRLLDIFLENKNIPPTKKDKIYGELLKIADNSDVKNAWVLFDALAIEEAKNYNPKLLPLIEKHFQRSVEFAKNYKSSENDDADYSQLPQKYGEILFRTYLAANDRQSAEKLLINGYYSANYGYSAIIGNAARNGAFDEALRYWKTKSNFDRQNLDDLSYMKNFPALAQSLRDFYAQMKQTEPNSQIPDKALQILK